MYEVMSGDILSGDTLSWKGSSPKQSTSDTSPESHFSGDQGAIKILKVCFCTNNNLGKNFKLVKCDSSWQIRVRTDSNNMGEGGDVSEDCDKEGSLSLFGIVQITDVKKTCQG